MVFITILYDLGLEMTYETRVKVCGAPHSPVAILDLNSLQTAVEFAQTSLEELDTIIYLLNREIKITP
jgi:hypothetical protein